jgi:hypothetical protein
LSLRVLTRADPPAFRLKVVLWFQLRECACSELLWQRISDVRAAPHLYISSREWYLLCFAVVSQIGEDVIID